MVIDEYRKVPRQVFDLSGFKPIRGVLNFLSDFLLHEEIVITYAPHSEFGDRTSHSWILGGWACRYDDDQLHPVQTVNYRTIKELYKAGYIMLVDNVKVPAHNIVTFRWTPEVIESRRKIALTHIYPRRRATKMTTTEIASLYGLTLSYISTKGLFEALKPDGSKIPKGRYKRSIAFANSDGEPVSRFGDMTHDEWDEFLLGAAKRANTLNSPLPASNGLVSHYSVFRRC
jgi:hypothetical protein